MASIFDFDETPSEPLSSTPTPESSSSTKRSKNREFLSSFEVAKGKRSLASMVEAAFQTLQTAMTEADYPTAIKAAQIVLDRAGFGPKSSMDVTTTNIDLSALTLEELANRAQQMAEVVRTSSPKRVM